MGKYDYEDRKKELDDLEANIPNYTTTRVERGEAREQINDARADNEKSK